MSINPGSEDPRRDNLLVMIKEGMKVVDADGIEPSVSVHEGGSGADA